MTSAEQRKAAKEFITKWQDKGYEKGESQPFWLSLLRDVYGVKDPELYITFENKVNIDSTSFIDGTISATHVLIEQKSKGKALNKPIVQSNGTKLTPFEQAKRYSANLPYSQRPRWIVTCNFEEFYIYDMEKPNGEPEKILLKDLEKECYRLQFLVDVDDENIQHEMDVSIQAGKIVGLLYDEILKQYHNPESEETLKSLNMLCVRLVFCLYAEDAGIFGGHNKFHNYIKSFSSKDLRKALIELFKILDTKDNERDPYEDEVLASFPYVNGGLFADENIEIPQLNETIKELILCKASENFDWSVISPTIFGAVFESTLNPETRHKGGMHYTSIENIHKVIDPLFLDELREEFEDIKAIKISKTKETKLTNFRKKLASLTFLDPACGSGNFLTETYLSLRRLENQALIETITLQKNQISGQIILDSGDITDPIMVHIKQFYGIEINDFAATVAKTALWIAESQMMKETEDIIHKPIDFLPLKSYANIVEANALHIDWETVIPKANLNYIMGNPPFLGARLMDKKQKEDLLSVFGTKWKNAGNLDYVACWYKKACDFIKDTSIKTALVSTNSISQGESVAILWKPLFEMGVHIDFAHRTFRWDNRAEDNDGKKIKTDKKMAAVHCVIIGFSIAPNNKAKVIYDSNRFQIVDNINGYLIDAPSIFVESRKKPICDIPNVVFGSMPNDSGHLCNYSQEDKDAILKDYPEAEIAFKQFMGADEFINNKIRWCLWLKGVSPNIIKKVSPINKAVSSVREMRENSSREATRKLASTPALFGEIRQPETEYIIIPRHSSENRKYIPMGFEKPDIICGDANLLMPEADLYHFGILTSNVHNAWIRAVCGRLEMRYRYSVNIVYNNFIWPTPTEEQKAKIEQTAQAILDARALYPECSLAVLYDENAMPDELRKAHQANDKAVMQAYGFWGKLNTESECVAELMRMYKELTE